MNTEQTKAAYQALSKVERAFRSLKAVDLQIRPIHHRLENRVKAHVFPLHAAYHVEWHLRQAWEPLPLGREGAQRPMEERRPRA